VAKWTSAGWEYYLQDAMGSVIGMANASGVSTANINYDSFGNIRSQTGASAAISSSIGAEPRYHGMLLDAVSGLYHVRARTYDARTGRFTSRDPIAGSVGQPESAHPYSFCRASPHLWVDPTGLMSMPELSGVQAGIGILANIAAQAAGAAFRAALATAVIGVGIVAMQQTRDDTRDRTLDVTTDLTRDDDPACVGPSINIGGEGEIPDAININTDLILDPNFVASRDGTTTIRDMQSRGQQFIAYDGSRLPIRSSSCCTVFTKSIPPYVKTQLFLEIRRVLKPNGVWVDYQFVGDAEVPYIRYRKGAFGL
jgi:RHS repeat-associated protein